MPIKTFTFDRKYKIIYFKIYSTLTEIFAFAMNLCKKNREVRDTLLCHLQIFLQTIFIEQYGYTYTISYEKVDHKNHRQTELPKNHC